MGNKNEIIKTQSTHKPKEQLSFEDWQKHIKIEANKPRKTQ